MQLFVSSKFEEEFVYRYLRNYIHDLTVKSVDDSKASTIDNAFKIKTRDVLSFATSNLLVARHVDAYIISVNKSLKYDGFNSLEKLVNLITYGTRDVKGYPVLLDIFRTIDVESVYRKWVTNGH